MDERQGAPWDDETTRPSGPAPSPLRPLTLQERIHAFGRFDFTHDPQPGNPEHVAIAHGWARDNLVPVTVPQLAGRRVTVHRKMVAPFLAFWADVEASGLRDRVITFDGTFASRYKRFSGTLGERLAKSRVAGVANLSNHAWASAFDINARWNRLGHEPAKLGEHGCVLELVPIAEKHGFFWGGKFKSRIDAMHFELARDAAR